MVKRFSEFLLSCIYGEAEVKKQVTGNAHTSRAHSRSQCLTKPLLGKAAFLAGPSQLRSAVQEGTSKVMMVGNNKYKDWEIKADEPFQRTERSQEII